MNSAQRIIREVFCQSCRRQRLPLRPMVCHLAMLVNSLAGGIKAI